MFCQTFGEADTKPENKMKPKDFIDLILGTVFSMSMKTFRIDQYQNKKKKKDSDLFSAGCSIFLHTWDENTSRHKVCLFFFLLFICQSLSVMSSFSSHTYDPCLSPQVLSSKAPVLNHETKMQLHRCDL